ncbi:MAG: hypothetical protein LBI33_13220 [Propionibacteriaceae bacterium]|jgi:hypothetical protein|nr:hypothetical protein [Propionibacteriaceae bacterium]
MLSLFRRHLMAVTLAAGAVAGMVAATRWQRTWGTVPAERRAGLPGDSLIPVPRLTATRAITIDAPSERVWPWLVQLGWQRGGFYTFDRVENLFGLGLRSADTINPDWQRLDVGSLVQLADGVALRVAVVDQAKTLVLFGDPSTETATMAHMPQFSFTWAFVLEPDGAGGSRLIVRERYAWTGVALVPLFAAVEWISFVMSYGMLRGIKDRAEGCDDGATRC